jgi:hypothetical protein
MEFLSKNILSTIIYYDILDYPLTAFEIWKYLVNSKNEEANVSRGIKEGHSFWEVMSVLESDDIRKYVDKCQGFYFLKGRQKLAGLRIERNKISEKKFLIIKRVVFWLRFCPFVKMVAVTGTMAMKNAEKSSDLDFLVVLKKGRIFTGRLLVTFLTHILGKRRHGEKITDRVCLNCYLSEKNLKIRTEDFFSASEYSFIIPIFGWSTFKKFQKENEWIRNFKNNWRADALGNLKMIKDSDLSKGVRKWGERFLGWNFLENFLGDWQKNRIAIDPRTKSRGSLIIADDEALVFLPEPQGPVVYEDFQKGLNKLGIELN